MSENRNQSGTAAVLSFVFSGLGQLYNGQIIKGLVIISFAALSLLSVMLGAVLIYLWCKQQIILNMLWWGIALFAVGLIFIAVLGVYSIFDAHKQASN